MENFIWYTTRATGITAYLLLFLTVSLGLLLSGRAGAWWQGVPVLALHRFVTWLVGVFLAIHVLILLFSSFLPFGPAQLFIPFTSTYEPFWTGVGVIAMYLVAIVVVTSVIRKRLQNVVWYGLHLLSYPAFVAATAHGISSGHDTRQAWMLAIYVACALVSGFLLAVRSTPRQKEDLTHLRRWAPGATVAVALSLMVGVLIGSRFA
jgi:hypothetical protein